MESANANDLASLQAGLLRDRRGLYAQLHEFNLLPSRHLHPSWHAALFPAAVQPLLERSANLDARVHRWLSAFLLEHPRIAQRAHWSPGPGLSIALLPPPALLDLARRMGAALASGTLRHLLTGKTAGEARRAMGDALHDFALQRAPLLVTRAELDAAAGQGGSIATESLGPAIEKLGAGALRAAWEGEGLWPRASLKLPSDLVAAVEAAPSMQPTACASLAQRIAREGSPQWHTYSASAAA